VILRPLGFATVATVLLAASGAVAAEAPAEPIEPPPPPVAVDDSPTDPRARSVDDSPTDPRARSVDAVEPMKPDAWQDVRRFWLYTPDPSAPPPLHVLASVGAGYATVDKGAGRPFAADVAHAGAVFNVGAEVGIVPVLSLESQVLLAGQSPQTNEAIAGGGMVGLTLHPLPAKWPLQATVSSGYLRELGGDNGLWFRAVVAGSAGRFRFGGSALGEHVFAQKAGERRDPLDLMLTAGASVAIVPWAEIGVEYVVQDLEEAGDDMGDDGGLKHFVGLTASLTPTKHLQLLAGPALGLSPGAPSVLGRGQVSYYF
jgi:hypothetical protein